MADNFPTFRRIGASTSEAYCRFSLAGVVKRFLATLVGRGGLWTMVCWLPFSLYCMLPYNLMAIIEYSAANSESSRKLLTSIMPMIYLLIFPGSPVTGFVTAFSLAGSSAGFLDSLWRGLKAVAVLFAVLMILALCAIIFGDEKGPLLAAVVFWIGVAVLLAGMLGGWSRLGYDRLSPAPQKNMAENTEAPVQAQAPDAREIAWLEAVARELGAVGLFDHATALRFHSRMAGSGQLAPGAVPPFEEKYKTVRDRVLAVSPGKTENDWTAANETLRLATLTAAKAGGKARSRLEEKYPGFSEEFYAWVLDCSRKLP